MQYNNVNFNDVIMFFRQFAVMLKAGIPISDCLHNFGKQKYGKSFKNVILSVEQDINSGVLLSAAFAKFPQVFPRYFINMVAIGEVSGTLDEIMTSMADYYENDRKIKKKVSSAMVYPTLLVCMIFFVIIFLCMFVLPQFESTIIQLGGEVPQITVTVLNIAKFIQNNILYIIIVAIAIIILMMLFFNTERGKYVKDVLKFKVPVISKIERNLLTARFSKAFLILLGSGMNMIDILENLSKMLGNNFFERKFLHAIDEVRHGKRISDSLEDTHLFPQMLIEMISVGENSGNLEEVLKSTVTYFDTQVESSIAKAVALVEPISIIILGAIVYFVVMSVLVPMISMMNAI